MTRAWPQASSLFTLPNLTTSWLYLRGPIGDDVVDGARGVADGLGEVADFFVGLDVLAVLDADFHEAPGDAGVDINAGNDQRAEEIALAAFVDAEVRLEPLGVVDFLVAEPGFAEHLRLEGEFHEFLGAFPLDDDLWAFFVNGEGEFVFLRVKKGVGLGRECPVLPHED